MTRKMNRAELAEALDWYIANKVRVFNWKGTDYSAFAALSIYGTIWLVVTRNDERKPQLLRVREQEAWHVLAWFQQEDKEDGR